MSHPVLNAALSTQSSLVPKTKFVEDAPAEPINHYARIYKGVLIDPYRICAIYEIEDAAVIQAHKKLIRFGSGQHKDRATDIAEAIQALQRWQQMQLEDAS